MSNSIQTINGETLNLATQAERDLIFADNKVSWYENTQRFNRRVVAAVGRVGGGTKNHFFAVTVCTVERGDVVIAVDSYCGSQRFNGVRRSALYLTGLTSDDVTCQKCTGKAYQKD